MIYIIKVLILYYLSIKPTHGYEIQKFIQMNHMDSWTKIQSGSIYYALNKLEKKGLIVLSEEVGTGAKARKVYSITEVGKVELRQLVKEELNHQISEVGSDKFIVYPLLNILDKDEMVTALKEHIEKLGDQKMYFEKWQKIKVNEQTLAVEKITFEMMLSNLEFQIKWHNALIDNMEECITASKEIAKLISKFDFSSVQDIEMDTAENIENLKYQILNNPDTAPEKLEQLIKALKK
ncbi:PadR family transcriptional regulator [Clostridium sp. CF012]|uniref:PadR family transcriptional regulator n=1 Tax=Clostridium sp. CF012 TaxID=2843319 RepID=UPI002815FD5A|nr:PadR family transcriptional regulator [Clostridium sp. CF012]